jgi:hypothetical protein
MQRNTLFILSFIILLLASISDLLFPVVIGRKYPGYNHFVHTISTLGTKKSPVQTYQCRNLIFVGVLLLLFAFGQYGLFEQTTWPHYWYTIGIMVFAVGCMFAGIFSEDPKGVTETPSGKIHGIASGIGFLFLILCPLWAMWIQELHTIKRWNAMCFALGLMTFLAFLASDRVTTGILRYSGLFQRMNLMILYGALLMNLTRMRGR